MVIDEKQRVLLVRHSYRDGWHLPGGAVDRGETTQQAVARELAEEAGIVCKESPQCVPGLMYNTNDFKHDHIILFVIKNWERDMSLKVAGEIIEDHFFGAHELPEDASPATKRRIAEYFKGEAPGFHW